MIIQLALVFALLAVHLRHLLQTIEHRLHNSIVCSIYIASDLETVRATKLTFDTIDIDREVPDEMGHSPPLLRVQFRLFDTFNLFFLYR